MPFVSLFCLHLEPKTSPTYLLLQAYPSSTHTFVNIRIDPFACSGDLSLQYNSSRNRTVKILENIQANWPRSIRGSDEVCLSNLSLTGVEEVKHLTKEKNKDFGTSPGNPTICQRLRQKIFYLSLGDVSGASSENVQVHQHDITEAAVMKATAGMAACCCVVCTGKHQRDEADSQQRHT
ncbi:uncharacterized protein V6R79_025215 [Siganus canaliculatus]